MFLVVGLFCIDGTPINNVEPLVFACNPQDEATDTRFVCQMDNRDTSTSFGVGYRLPSSTNQLDIRGWKQEYGLTVMADKPVSLRVISIDPAPDCLKIAAPGVRVIECVSE